MFIDPTKSSEKTAHVQQPKDPASENMPLIFNDPRVVQTQELARYTGLHPAFTNDMLMKVINDPDKARDIQDFKNVFQMQYDMQDFEKIFSDFALTHVFKTGSFDPSEALREWPEYLKENAYNVQESSQYVARLQQQSANVVPGSLGNDMPTGESHEVDPSTVEHQATAPVPGTLRNNLPLPAAPPEEVLKSPFSYLYDIIDQYIDFNTICLKLGMTYSLLVQQQTKLQEAYLERQRELKPLTISSGLFQDVTNEEAQKQIDTFNTTVLTSYQDTNRSYNDITQDYTKQLMEFVNSFTSKANSSTDSIASYLSMISSCTMSILR